jgi:hypothetical protein
MRCYISSYARVCGEWLVLFPLLCSLSSFDKFQAGPQDMKKRVSSAYGVRGHHVFAADGEMKRQNSTV